MSIKTELSLLKTNIQNAKNKLYTNLVDKGVKDITTASTLDVMADSVSDIVTGTSSGGVAINNQTKTITITENGNQIVNYDYGFTGLESVNVIVDVKSDDSQQNVTNVNMGFDFSPSYLAKHLNERGNYFWDDNDECLYYPTGNFILSEQWQVQKYDGYDSWSAQNKLNNEDWYTYFPEDWIEFSHLKRKYPIVCGKWSNTECKDLYYTPEEMYKIKDEQTFYNLYEIYTTDIYGNEIILKYSSDNSFYFYYLNDSGEYEHYYHSLPNGGEPTFYPIFEKIPYCRNYNPYSFEDDVIEFIGVNIETNEANSYGEWNINRGDKLIKSSYINFFDWDYKITNKLYWRYIGDWEERFQYLTSVYRIERITYDTSQVNVKLDNQILRNTELDYIGEIIFEENLNSFSLIHNETNIEYCLLKNIGIAKNMQYFVCDSHYWGINNKYKGSHQAAIDSLITYSFDRASANYPVLKLNLYIDFVNTLDESQIAQITAKGFTIIS